MALDIPDCQSVEQDVGRTWRYRGGGRGAGSGGDLTQDAGLLRFARPERCTERLQVRLACRADVERFQATGGTDQQPGRLVTAPLLERDLAPEMLGLGGTQLIRRPDVRGRQQV